MQKRPNARNLNHVTFVDKQTNVGCLPKNCRRENWIQILVHHCKLVSKIHTFHVCKS